MEPAADTVSALARQTPSRRTAAPAVEDRRVLVDRHLRLVYSISINVFRSIRGAVELDDLIGFGTEGLLQAAGRFDPSRGCTFATFAYPRIHGAIYDGIRQLAPLPSPLYRRVFGDRRDRDAEPDGQVLFVTSLDAHVALGHQLAAPQRTAEQEVMASELRDLVDHAMNRLPRREQELIRAHYFQDDSLQHIGRRLGVTRSWASRLHARAIDHLRRSMATVGVAA